MGLRIGGCLIAPPGERGLDVCFRLAGVTCQDALGGLFGIGEDCGRKPLPARHPLRRDPQVIGSRRRLPENRPLNFVGFHGFGLVLDCLR